MPSGRNINALFIARRFMNLMATIPERTREGYSIVLCVGRALVTGCEAHDLP